MIENEVNKQVDPTKNVLDLVEAAVKRLDDLHKSDDKRQSNIITLVIRHIKEVADLRADYDEKLRGAETARIDAIRAVDVGNVQRAAEVQATQALALATQVTTSAETLRNQVVAAQSANNTALAAALDPIQKAIEDLRRVQYEGVGQKTQVVETQAKTGINGMVVGLIISLLLGVIGIGITLIFKN